MLLLQSPSKRSLGIIKTLLFVLALLPFVRLLVFTYLDRLGANPLEFIERNTGDWTLYFLCLTLSVTPLRRYTQWHWLLKMRRMLGLFVFFYASLHFLTFIWFDHFFDLPEMFKDVLKRPFIAVGLSAFVLLLPLALTSTNAMVRRLGGQRWQWLHRLIYVIGLLGIVHYWWMKAGKNDVAQPLLFALIMALLLALRIFWRYQKHRTS
jgi:methionine sulfoxide reductase heme-binding subunit